jgi:hypothetical protein
MPLRWSIDHERRRVVATLLQTTTEQEIYEFLGEVIGAGAMPYGKLFDATAAVRWITASRVGPLASTARLYSRMGLGPIGPLAIVVADARAIARAQEYAVMSDAATRQARIFASVAEAEAWLDSPSAADSSATE